MYRISLSFALCLLLSFSLFSSAESDNPNVVTPAFWQVKNGAKGQVYILGSMHFGHRSFYPMHDKILNAFDRSDMLIVEVDISKINLTEISLFMDRHGSIAKGTLADILGDKLNQQLEGACDKLGIDIGLFAKSSPWLVAMQLASFQITQTDFKAEYGIDNYFIGQATHTEKPIESLESFNSQLKIFSELNISEQVMLLEQALVDFDRGESYLHQLANAWKTGDSATIDQLVVEAFRNKQETKDLFKMLITDRNIAMAEKIKGYLETDGTYFVVVGAGHVVGELGLVELLSSDYTLTKVLGQ